MRRLLTSGFVMILAGTANFALAQTKTPTPGARLSHVSYEKGTVHSSTHAFNVQLKKTVDEISKGMKTGKLTQAQAQTMMEKVKTIRIQELQFFKENGNKELTSGQINQLNQSLTQLSSSL